MMMMCSASAVSYLDMFYMCTDDVKIALFRAYCTSFYKAHLWCSYSKAKMKKLQVAFNDVLRILLKLPRWISASQMFVSNDVPTLHAVLRNYMHSFMCPLSDSRNTIIMDLSGKRYSSLLWKHWNSSLYVFKIVFYVCYVCYFFTFIFVLWTYGP